MWTQGIIASYFDPSVASAQSRSAVDDRSRATDSATSDEDARLGLSSGGGGEDAFGGDGFDSDETEGEVDPLAFTVVGSIASDAGGVVADGVVDDSEHPNLGTIDSVIEFLMSERDRVQAGRLVERRMVQHYSSTSDGGARQSQDAEARRARKWRRRKKPTKTIQILRREVPQAPETVSETTVHLDDASGDADRDDADVDVPEAENDSSSSPDNAHHHYKSTPSTPPRTNRVLIKRDVLKHSKSTPTLKVQTIPPDPQILKLRCLAHKLRLRFPEDYERITVLLTQDFSGGESDFSDPRGPAPRARDTLIHVFIDQLSHPFRCLVCGWASSDCDPFEQLEYSHWSSYISQETPIAIASSQTPLTCSTRAPPRTGPTDHEKMPRDIFTTIPTDGIGYPTGLRRPDIRTRTR